MPTETGHWITLDGNHIFISGSAGSVPRRLQPAAGEKTRFSKAELERHLIAHHEAVAGKGTYTAHDEKRLNEAAGAGDPFTFHKKLPTEIKEFQAGRPELRSMFKVSGNSAEAGGADAFGELGDKYLDIAEAKAGSPLRAAKRTAHGSSDPEVKFLAAVHDNLPEGRFSGDTIESKGLRVGDQFTIGGSKFRVAEDDQGMRVLEGGKDYPETPVDALRQIPVDKGSFKPGKRQREVIPFSGDSATVLSLSTDPAKPALVIGQGLPKEIGGEKCHYVRKEVARVGHYVHRGQRMPDGKRMEFDISSQRLDKWLDAFQKRKAAGIRPFLPHRHVTDEGEYIDNVNDARANFGFAVDADREGDSLYTTLQLIGDKALSVAAANDVSIYVDTDAADSEGHEYGECIKHICLTPDPIIPHLKPFTRIAASADQPAREVPVYVLDPTPTAAPSRRSYRMKPETAQKVRTALGFGADVPDDQLDDKAAEKALALSADVTTLTQKVTDLTTERDAKAAQVLSLSADAPRKPDDITLAMYADNVSAKRDAAIRAGALTEAEAKNFDALVADSAGMPTALALSACGTDRKPLAFKLWDAIGKLGNNALRTGNAVQRGATVAEPLALAGDEKKDKPNPDEVAELRRLNHIAAPAAK